jgi:hypothetical protein
VNTAAEHCPFTELGGEATLLLRIHAMADDRLTPIQKLRVAFDLPSLSNDEEDPSLAFRERWSDDSQNGST